MPTLAITLVQWLELQKVRLMARFPFYGILLSYLTLRSDLEVPIAATDGFTIFYNPDFFAQLLRAGDDLTTQGLLVHETLHPALGHFWRKGSRDHERWNCDWSNGDQPEAVERIDDLKDRKDQAEATALRDAKARIDNTADTPEWPAELAGIFGPVANVIDEFLRVCDRQEMMREVAASIFPELKALQIPDPQVQAEYLRRADVLLSQDLEKIFEETMVCTVRRFGSFLAERIGDVRERKEAKN